MTLRFYPNRDGTPEAYTGAGPHAIEFERPVSSLQYTITSSTVDAPNSDTISVEFKAFGSPLWETMQDKFSNEPAVIDLAADETVNPRTETLVGVWVEAIRFKHSADEDFSALVLVQE